MDPISDMLTRIRNAYQRGQKSTLAPHSNFKHAVAMTLARCGYLKKLETSEEEGKKTMKIFLKYRKGAPTGSGSETVEPAIIKIKKISKPGQRIYSGSEKLQRLGGRRGMIVISTSKGVMPHWEAKKQKVGGEVVCVVY